MSYNAMIIKGLEAEKYLALILQKSVKEVGKESLKQAELIYDGFERLTWYLSFFTEKLASGVTGLSLYGYMQKASEAEKKY